METSRAKQIKDGIHYYLWQLKSIGLITIHALTINNMVFTKYLCKCNMSHQIKLFSFLKDIEAYSLSDICNAHQR